MKKTTRLFSRRQFGLLKKIGLIVLTAVLFCLGVFKWQEMRRANVAAAQAAKAKKLLNYDIRVTGKEALAEMVRTKQSVVAAQVRSQAQAATQGLARLRTRVPSAEAKFSSLTGAV